MSREVFYNVGMIARIGPTKPHRHYLRAWREFRNLTQEQLAERLETGKDQISRWENGKRGMSVEVQFALAEALNIEPQDLFRDPHIPSIDVLLRNASPEKRQQALKVVEALLQAS